jgi:hypothetical protein
MDNIHTYASHRLNLVIARVLLMHGEGFKFTSDMISDPRVKVPIGINGRRRSHCRHAVIKNKVFIIPVLTCGRGMPNYHADLGNDHHEKVKNFKKPRPQWKVAK